MDYNYHAFEAVLNQIEKEPETFDMGNWCGTTKCIAGWTCTIFKEKTDKRLSICYNALSILGMDKKETDLFHTGSNNDVIKILKVLVSQKDLPAEKQQSINEIAESLNVQLGVPF